MTVLIIDLSKDEMAKLCISGPRSKNTDNKKSCLRARPGDLQFNHIFYAE